MNWVWKNRRAVFTLAFFALFIVVLLTSKGLISFYLLVAFVFGALSEKANKE